MEDCHRNWLARGRASRVFLIRLAVVAWANCAAGWRALPRGNLRRWALSMTVGAALCAGLMAVLARFTRALVDRGLQAWDERLLRQIERGPLSFHDAIAAESPGNVLYLLPLTLGIALAGARAARPILAMSFVAGYVIARPLFRFGWVLWDRPRPRIILGGVATPELHSFPSGHVVLGVTVYGLLAYLWMSHSRSWIERAFACLLTAAWVAVIALGRLRLGTHWPSDIIGGVVLGLAWLAVVIYATRAGERSAPHDLH